jgi:hypothetical protein
LCFRQIAAVTKGDHNPDHPAIAKGHTHATTNDRLRALWRQIIKQAGQGDGQGDLDYGHNSLFPAQ